jgi:hypothetical protein
MIVVHFFMHIFNFTQFMTLFTQFIHACFLLSVFLFVGEKNFKKKMYTKISAFVKNKIK